MWDLLAPSQTEQLPRRDIRTSALTASEAWESLSFYVFGVLSDAESVPEGNGIKVTYCLRGRASSCCPAQCRCRVYWLIGFSASWQPRCGERSGAGPRLRPECATLRDWHGTRRNPDASGIR